MTEDTAAAQQWGEVHGILGPMHGGKTTELMRRLVRESLAGRKVMAIKWEKDDRYSRGAELVSHDKRTMPAVMARELLPLVERVRQGGYHVVGVDEGQFFPDLVEFCCQLADVLRVRVHVAALNGNFRRIGFGNITELYAHLNTVQILQAVCQREGCGADAPFTHLAEAGANAVGEDGQTPIVGALWESLCRRHYLAAIREQ